VCAKHIQLMACKIRKPPLSVIGYRVSAIPYQVTVHGKGGERQTQWQPGRIEVTKLNQSE